MLLRHLLKIKFYYVTSCFLFAWGIMTSWIAWVGNTRGPGGREHQRGTWSRRFIASNPRANPAPRDAAWKCVPGAGILLLLVIYTKIK